MLNSYSHTEYFGSHNYAFCVKHFERVSRRMTYGEIYSVGVERLLVGDGGDYLPVTELDVGKFCTETDLRSVGQ